MTDTPEHLKNLQLQIWLSKPPGERLRQFLSDNDDMFKFWRLMKEQMQQEEVEDKKSVE